MLRIGRLVILIDSNHLILEEIQTICPDFVKLIDQKEIEGQKAEVAGQKLVTRSLDLLTEGSQKLQLAARLQSAVQKARKVASV